MGGATGIILEYKAVHFHIMVRLIFVISMLLFGIKRPGNIQGNM